MTDLPYSVNKSSVAGTILVVDDSAGARRMITTILREGNFACVEAEHGLAALAVLQTTPIDLMVTDLQMPEMDGFALIAAMPGLPEGQRPRHIIVCSALLGESGVGRSGLEAAAACLAKPVSPAVLLRTVTNVLCGPEGAYAGAGRS